MAPSDLTPLTSSRPLTIKEISDRGERFSFNPAIPLTAWLRTGNTLSQEGRIYLQDGNFAQAYLLYIRYLTLLLKCLPSHPDAKSQEGKRALNEVNKTVPDIVINLEKIKPIIQREYDEWNASEARRQQQLREKRRADLKSPSTYEEHTAQDPALSSSNRLLDAGDNQDLAVELARNEIRRRDANRKAIRRTNVPPEEEQTRRTAGFWDHWTDDLANRQAEDEELFRRQMESTRRELDRSDIPQNESHPPAIQGHSNYRYPSITRSQPIQYEALQPYRKPSPSPQPPRPPKEGIVRQLEPSPSYVPAPLTPELPAEDPIRHERNLLPTPPPKEYDDPPRPPKVHEDPPLPPKKQQRLTFKPAAYLESGEPIRSIFLPSQLRRQFLSIASENTRRGLEMCGILCGTAVNNALFVRCLLIPEQNCTSDTCETENEESMFEYCMNEDLLVLGWIHTHPTQTCFMSSRDLHTQSGYQVMLPESIAIVCAPKFQPSYGIFRLTHPPGLDHILNCKQSATFHPHSVDNLYTKAQHPPGHVYETDRLEFYVHDLRPGARNNTVQHKNF
ncbi:uncharacterized protein GGS22DRAFT_120756 [Annulohypoxylon maeteangense]|uniref:uncharacterized protein n=1 Tax=Annulohypoxylon maeteangense TaxID=1927788 RepID=UPI0020085E53|nr:uncharacterized protein GGS22DRAFT_120756 [Annulohypoxylon maeteangense]KAI0887038.1 hypothetical protein GGS22DRAFT_120756 [Annulohypoxylon maeteangense]